jgi:hypothetical protein
MPTPPTGRCQEVVQATWYLTFSVGRWPTFAELDRWVDRHNDIEIVEAIREMPPGILYGVNPDRYMTPSDDQEIGLTAAGIAACPDTEEILSVYVEFVRLATEVEKYWQPPLDAPNARPDLTDVDFASNSRLLPAAGRDDVLQLVLLIIKTEGAGWAGLSRTNDGPSEALPTSTTTGQNDISHGSLSRRCLLGQSLQTNRKPSLPRTAPQTPPVSPQYSSAMPTLIARLLTFYGTHSCWQAYRNDESSTPPAAQPGYPLARTYVLTSSGACARPD